MTNTWDTQGNLIRLDSEGNPMTPIAPGSDGYLTPPANYSLPAQPVISNVDAGSGSLSDLNNLITSGAGGYTDYQARDAQGSADTYTAQQQYIDALFKSGFLPLNPTAPSAGGMTALQMMNKINPGGSLVTGSDGKTYWKVNPAGWADSGLSASPGGLAGFFTSPVGMMALGLAGAGALGLLGEGAGIASGAGGYAGGTIAGDAYLPGALSAGGYAAGDAFLPGALGAGGGATAAAGATGGAPFMDSFMSGTAEDAGLTSGNAANYASATGVVPGAAGELSGGGSLLDILKSIPQGTSSAVDSLLKSLGSGASNLLGGGTGGGLDLTKLLGTLGAGALSAVGFDKARGTLHDIYDQITGARAPAQNAYNNAVLNPNTWYQSAPAMGAADAASRALSAKGNPADNPTLMSQLAANQLGGYNQYLNMMAGPAFGGQQYQTQLGQNLASLAMGLPNSLAQGLGSLTGTDQNSMLLNSLRNLFNPANSAGTAGTLGSPDFTNSFNNTNPFGSQTPVDPSQLTGYTPQPDLLSQYSQQPNDWFGSQQQFGSPYNLNNFGSF